MYLRRVLQNDGLQHGLRGMATARVGVPVARKFEALLQLVWRQIPAVGMKVRSNALTCKLKGALDRLLVLLGDPCVQVMMLPTPRSQNFKTGYGAPSRQASRRLYSVLL